MSTALTTVIATKVLTGCAMSGLMALGLYLMERRRSRLTTRRRRSNAVRKIRTS